VVRFTTIRIVLSITVSSNWTIRQLDVQNIFLHGDLNENVFMTQPLGFTDPNKPNHVCLLSKALYGLKQSSRAWFHKLHSVLLQLEFCDPKYDPSLFIASHDGNITIMLIYVDDIIITDNNS
jgi:Reverse transcriptase (RNA-dependent DNA polymerase)